MHSSSQKSLGVIVHFSVALCIYKLWFSIFTHTTCDIITDHSAVDRSNSLRSIHLMSPLNEFQNDRIISPFSYSYYSVLFPPFFTVLYYRFFLIILFLVWGNNFFFFYCDVECFKDVKFPWTLIVPQAYVDVGFDFRGSIQNLKMLRM